MHSQSLLTGMCPVRRALCALPSTACAGHEIESSWYRRERTRRYHSNQHLFRLLVMILYIFFMFFIGVEQLPLHAPCACRVHLWRSALVYLVHPARCIVHFSLCTLALVVVLRPDLGLDGNERRSNRPNTRFTCLSLLSLPRSLACSWQAGRSIATTTSSSGTNLSVA